MVEVAACAVGRLGADGPWVGFAPTLDDGYALVVGGADGGRAERPRGGGRPARAGDRLLRGRRWPSRPRSWRRRTATSARSCATSPSCEDEPTRRRRLGEAVDAVDDGLAADVVVGRLSLCLEGGEEPVARLARRSAELLAAEDERSRVARAVLVLGIVGSPEPIDVHGRRSAAGAWRSGSAAGGRRPGRAGGRGCRGRCRCVAELELAAFRLELLPSGPCHDARRRSRRSGR